MKTLLIACFAILASFSVAQAPISITTVQSSHDFVTTVSRLDTAITEAGLTIMAVVDHQANAGRAELDLRPTTLFIFGNPNVGTPLMQAQQTVAIDLPQKMLVWQDEDGQVYVGFNSPYYLRARHRIEGQDQRLDNINNALTNLAKQAALP